MAPLKRAPPWRARSAKDGRLRPRDARVIAFSQRSRPRLHRVSQVSAKPAFALADAIIADTAVVGRAAAVAGLAVLAALAALAALVALAARY